MGDLGGGVGLVGMDWIGLVVGSSTSFFLPMVSNGWIRVKR